jgi:peptide deformylase
MAKLQIKYDGNKVLRKKSNPVKVVDSLAVQLMDDMLETMHANNGIGLAAPQVGINKRIIVIDLGGEEDEPIRMVNPRICEREGSVVGLEGCLSIPNVYGDVDRAERVLVRGLNEKGKAITVNAKGLLARVFQHEIDHLDGKLFTDVATNIREYTREELDDAEAEGRYEPALDSI